MIRIKNQTKQRENNVWVWIIVHKNTTERESLGIYGMQSWYMDANIIETRLDHHIDYACKYDGHFSVSWQFQTAMAFQQWNLIEN